MIVAYLVLGLVAGILSGCLGIGGGLILVPAMVYLFGMSQHLAQGTTLAIMVPPIGLLAAWQYYRSGNVKLDMAVLICLGFFVGGFIGAHYIQNVPDMMLRKIFAGFLLVVSVGMLFGK